MRQIVLNGVNYKISSDLLQRRINPWKAQLGSGSLEYADFSQAELEEYHDFRNGIGKKRAVGSDARLDFSQGIDFANQGQTILGPLVTTAGSFGVAPVKILDFESVTYGIGDNAIRRWNTTTSNWDYADPFLIHDCEAVWNELVDGDATVTLDTTIEKQGSGCAKMIVGAGLASGDIIAADDITTLDLSSSEKVVLWVQCTETRASGDLQLLLDNTAQCASPVETIDIPALVANTWTQVTLTLSNPTNDIAIISVGLKFTTNAEACTIYLDHIRGTFPDPIDAIVITDATDSYLVVTSSVKAVSTVDGTTWTTYGIEDFTTYTEVDANNKLTVISNRATGADVDRDEDVYLYKDFGAAFFDNLDVNFELYIAAGSTGSGLGGIAISNTVGSMQGFASTDMSAVITETGGGAHQIFLYRGNAVANDNYTGSANTLYYCTLERSSGADTVYLKIYSDLARATLLDTLSVSGFSTTTYRYAYGFVNKNSTGSGQNFDGYTQNLSFFGRGYMADFENRLYSISTDGKKVGFSVAKDIDDFASTFYLTGNFGTVYRLFEGKLLSDGSATLYFCGTEGLFTIDTTNAIAYKQEVAYPNTTNAGNVGIYWNANVWVATGYGILKVAPSVATFVGPDQDDGLPTGYHGKIYDFATVNNWLVYCGNGGSTDYSFIFKRNSTLGGNLEVYITSAVNKPIAAIHHSPSSQYTNGRLWFGEDTSIKYMMMPDTTSNVKQVATYEYVNDSSFGQFPIFRKLAAISKTALGVAAITKSCDEDDFISVFYGLNGAGPVTSLGAFKTSPKPTTLTFNSGLGTEFYTIQFCIKLFRGSTNTNSPELESLLFYYLPVPSRISSWQFTVLAGEDDSAEIFSAFETIFDTNTLVAFYPSGDTGKTKYNVKLTQMPSRNWWEEMGAREGQFTVVVEQIFSA